MLMTDKRGRSVTHNKRTPSVKSHDHTITWLCYITGQTKTIISTLPQCL